MTMSAEEFARVLISKGLVDEKQAWNLLTTTELTNAATILHATCCLRQHGDATGCTWYTEETTINPWEGLYHVKWLDKCIKLMNELNINPIDLLSTVRQASLILEGSRPIDRKILQMMVTSAIQLCDSIPTHASPHSELSTEPEPADDLE